nr:EOG090X05XL [Polyphemus pediculus]
MSSLFNNEDNSEDENDLKINNSYAENYNQWREKEEYQKLKDKYGEGAAMRMINDVDEDSSSTSESEDDTGEAWTRESEENFLKTLASIKARDPKIYDTQKLFFKKDTPAEPLAKKKRSGKDETMTIRDYERLVVVQNEGRFSDDEGPSEPTFREEQEAIKRDFKKVVSHLDSEDDDDLLTLRSKTESQKAKEEDDFKEWLLGQKDIVNEDTKKSLKSLKDYWDNPKLDENEKFLKDFILNERYKEKDDSNYIPSYEEIIHDSEGDLSEDERTLEQQTEFEHKYNFRFEEPDPEYIKRYPRTIAESLRRQDDSRKRKRDEIKERKTRDKEQKKEDLKQLKKFKLKEIEEKLEQLKTITGNSALPFQDQDFDEDFDPDQHDQKMKEIFDDKFYDIEEDDQKPEFPYDEELDNENWDNYTGQEEAGPSTSHSNWDHQPHCEDPDFNMDADYEEYDPKKANMDEMIQSTHRGKGRRKSVFAKKLESKKPIFDPKDHPNYEEYIEEFYKLDYEDIIGDLPVRFKYRKVVPNDFGLDTEEILAARDKELNRWCSVKKTCQYRAENEEINDVHTFKNKKKNLELKKKLLPSLFVENPEELLIEDQEKSRQKRRKNQGKEELPLVMKSKDEIIQDQPTITPEDESPQLNSDQNCEQQKEKLKKKKKKTKNGGSIESNSHKSVETPESQVMEQSDTQLKKKKKKKNKNKAPINSQDKEVCPEKVLPSEQLGIKTKTKKKEKNSIPTVVSSVVSKKKTFKSSKHHAPVKDAIMEMSDERFQAYGLNPKQFRNKIKYGKSSNS